MGVHYCVKPLGSEVDVSVSCLMQCLSRLPTSSVVVLPVDMTHSFRKEFLSTICMLSR